MREAGNLLHTDLSKVARSVYILSRCGEEDFEAVVVRGALCYLGIQSRIVSTPCDSDDALFYVDLSTGAAVPGIVVRAGRLVTRECRKAVISLKPNEIVLYGEPYAQLQRFTLDKRSLDDARGKRIIGPLFDVTRYRTPFPIKSDHAAVLASLGCHKRCGYCSHGSACTYLYGREFSRRSRPWRDLHEELEFIRGMNIDNVWMLADQFLSSEPEQNKELAQLASEWSAPELGRPTLHFTVSPREVLNNKLLLTSMSDSFDLCPRLSIDSFDDSVLNFLNLDFDSEMALQAFSVLASLRTRLRVSYLMIRPWATIESIKNELSYFAQLASRSSYLDPLDRLLLAHDLFSGTLKVVPGSPLATDKLVSPRYYETVPSCLLRIVLKVEAALEKYVSRMSSDCLEEADDPLSIVLDAAQMVLQQQTP